MSKIAIVADSTAGLSAAYVQEHDIATIPLYLKMGDQTLRDGIDITQEEFYARLPKTNPLPTTSQPSAGDFQQLYGRLIDDGAEAIISVHLSAGISGTINSAKLASQEFPDMPIKIVDTMSAVAAHQLCVEAGVLARIAGADLEGVVDAMQAVVEQQRMVFAVETLEYLYKGGRIGGAAALVGSLLQFKPLLYLVDGKIDALERVRTTNRALKRIVDLMVEWLGTEVPLRAIVMNADCRPRAEAVADHLTKRLNIVDVQHTYISPVIGTHVGPGTIGLSCAPQELFEF